MNGDVNFVNVNFVRSLSMEELDGLYVRINALKNELERHIQTRRANAPIRQDKQTRLEAVNAALTAYRSTMGDGR